MDVLVKFLNKYNFVRLSVSVRPPVVIHCVPGAGKTSLIREIIQGDNRFIAYTYGVPDQPNLEGCWIRKIPEKFPEDKFVLVDEYTLGDNYLGAFAVFGDPLQSNKQEPLAAHFVCNFSHRFGSNTATFLKSLGYKIEAEGADSVEVLDIFEAEPEGQVVYFETEVGELLCKHGVEAKRYTEIIGQTFDCVTFVTSENQPLSNPVATFQCATRHRRKLLILCPDASYSSA